MQRPSVTRQTEFWATIARGLARSSDLLEQCTTIADQIRSFLRATATAILVGNSSPFKVVGQAGCSLPNNDLDLGSEVDMASLSTDWIVVRRHVLSMPGPKAQADGRVACKKFADMEGQIAGLILVEGGEDWQPSKAALGMLAPLAEMLPRILVRSANHQRQAEKAAWLEGVLNAIPDEVMAIDHDCRILLVNQAKKRHYGEHIDKTDPKTGKRWMCCKLFENRDTPRDDCYARAVLQGAPSVEKALWVSELGEIVELSAGPIRNSDDRVVGSVEVCRHVDRRERLYKWMPSLLAKPDCAEVYIRTAEFVHQYLDFPRVRLYVACAGKGPNEMAGKRLWGRHPISEEDFQRLHLSLGSLGGDVQDRRVLTTDNPIVLIQSKEPRQEERAGYWFVHGRHFQNVTDLGQIGRAHV